MTICNDSHEEIVYDSSGCPLCEALASLEEEKDFSQNLGEEILEHQSIIEDLKIKLEELKANV